MNFCAKEITYGYSSTRVLNGISFSVEKGECTAILGINGVGKSTLLKCLNNILKPHSGKVFIDGECTDKIERNKLATKIGYVAQSNQFPDISVFDAVLLGRKPYIKWDVTKKDIEIVQNILEKLGLTSFALRSVNAMSGGERQKVTIARALAQQPDILLFDEPTSNLDLKNQLGVVQLIREIIKKHNISAIVTMHDLNLALRFADKFILMDQGRVFACGDRNVINEKNIHQVYGVEVTVQKYDEQFMVIPKQKQGGKEA
ncbi:MAG: ABC transporter ATP-binding protein [Bacillota bacterium]|jgi:iron complex transport system ATP-binding protein